MSRGISWYGGKQYMVRHLLPLIPAHKTYVEPFGGGAALLLQKPPSPVEVYNDINKHLVNFFRVLRDPQKFERLQRFLMLTPYSRVDHDDACERYADETLENVERAALFYIASQQSLNGIPGGAWARNKFYSRNGMAKKVSAWLGNIAGLEEIAMRLLTVQIECADFEKVIRDFDSPDTFFYLDPPYLPETRVVKSAYEYEMSIDDHVRMLDLIRSLQGKVMLSGYANDLYDRYLADWTKKEFDAVTHASLKGRGERTEVVWMNYEAWL